MPDGLGVVILFVGVVGLMLVALWRHRQKEGTQELLVQLTRTAIALVMTFSILYSMLHEIKVPEGILTLFGVVITLYFKGEKVLREKEDPPKEEEDADR